MPLVFCFYFLLQSFAYCRSTYLQTVLHRVISYYWPVDLHIFLQQTNHHVAKKKLHVPQRIVNRKTDNFHNSSCTPKDVDLWEKTSCWQFGHHKCCLDFYYVRCMEYSRTLLVAMCRDTLRLGIYRQQKKCLDLTRSRVGYLKENGDLFTHTIDKVLGTL